MNLATMVASELKTRLIQQILDIENPALLEHLTEYFRIVKDDTDWWNELTSTQQQFIQQSSQQAREGKVVSRDDARKKVNQILKKP